MLAECKAVLEDNLKVSSEILDRFVAEAVISATDKMIIMHDLTHEGKVKRLLLKMDGHGDEAVVILIDCLKNSENRLEKDLGNTLATALANRE